MNLFVPSSPTICGAVTQLVVFRSAFCCSVNPVDGEGHEMSAVLAVARRMVSAGAPGVCSAKRDQNPPTSEKLSPVIGWALASDWPTVPLTAKAPPVLVPPPPSMVNQLMERDWA